VRLEIESTRKDDGGHDDEKRSRELRHHGAKGEQCRERGAADEDRGAARFVELAQDLSELWGGSVASMESPNSFPS
jgi:hypothetical protein